jgi:hypothetical protein
MLTVAWDKGMLTLSSRQTALLGAGAKEDESQTFSSLDRNATAP